MHDTDPRTDFIERARVVLDWTIFTLGVLSLSAAITATILSKTDLFGDTGPATQQSQPVKAG